MILITDKEYHNKLMVKYASMLEEQTGCRVLLDSSFYIGLEKWAKKEYNVTVSAYAGSKILLFDDQQDYTLFLLKIA